MNEDILLAIDTSGPRLQLALARQGVIDTVVEEIARGHAEIIFDRIAALLARNATAYGDLSRLAVTTGPGSFTGLRIGLSAARGLALALKIPVIGVPTLLAVSLGAQQQGPLAVLADARRGEAYVQQFKAPGLPEGAPHVLPANDARAGLPQDLPVIESFVPDIAAMARFAAQAEPEAFPPTPAYVRPPDAKPQDKGRVARSSELNA